MLPRYISPSDFLMSNPARAFRRRLSQEQNSMMIAANGSYPSQRDFYSLSQTPITTETIQNGAGVSAASRPLYRAVASNAGYPFLDGNGVVSATPSPYPPRNNLANAFDAVQPTYPTPTPPGPVPSSDDHAQHQPAVLDKLLETRLSSITDSLNKIADSQSRSTGELKDAQATTALNLKEYFVSELSKCLQEQIPPMMSDLSRVLVSQMRSDREKILGDSEECFARLINDIVTAIHGDISSKISTIIELVQKPQSFVTDASTSPKKSTSVSSDDSAFLSDEYQSSISAVSPNASQKGKRICDCEVLDKKLGESLEKLKTELLTEIDRSVQSKISSLTERLDKPRICVAEASTSPLMSHFEELDGLFPGNSDLYASPNRTLLSPIIMSQSRLKANRRVTFEVDTFAPEEKQQKKAVSKKSSKKEKSVSAFSCSLPLQATVVGEDKLVESDLESCPDAYFDSFMSRRTWNAAAITGRPEPR